jgi:hypothetical protein
MTRIVDQSKTPTRFAMSLWNACGLWPEAFDFGPNRQIDFVRLEDYARLEAVLREIGDSCSGPAADYTNVEERGNYWKKETIRLRLLARSVLQQLTASVKLPPAAVAELRALAAGLDQSAMFMNQTAGTLRGMAESLTYNPTGDTNG